MRISILIFLLCLIACNKSKFLDEKPDASLVVPQSLVDLQAILDNTQVMNGGNMSQGGLDPYFLEIINDDLTLTSSIFNVLPQDMKNMYIFADDVYTGGDGVTNWLTPYRAVYYSNLALDGLTKIDRNESNWQQFDNVRGSGLFFRARMWFQLLQAFSSVFDKNNSSVTYGIPLRAISDVNEVLKRAKINECYDKIIAELKEASILLPIKPLAKSRPSKPAAYAMLAKTYLIQGNYDSALLYSDKCLQIHNELLDYRTLSTSASYPFPSRYEDNKEIIFFSLQITTTLLTLSDISNDFYDMYDANDLRRSLYFRQVNSTKRQFKATYDPSRGRFTGIATDEVLLIRAECNARLGNMNECLIDLNTLLLNRWRDGTFVPLTASTPDQALTLVLLERRKELVFRGIRFSDIKRLNRDGAGITLTRSANGNTYTLNPNDLRFTFLIPPQVIAYNPTMPQNPR